jgi:hypothetical protein
MSDECAIFLDSIGDTVPRKLPRADTCLSRYYHPGCIKDLRERGVNDLSPQCRAPLPPGAEESFYQANLRLVRADRMAEGNRMWGHLMTEGG